MQYMLTGSIPKNRRNLSSAAIPVLCRWYLWWLWPYLSWLSREVFWFFEKRAVSTKPKFASIGIPVVFFSFTNVRRSRRVQFHKRGIDFFIFVCPSWPAPKVTLIKSYKNFLVCHSSFHPNWKTIVMCDIKILRWSAIRYQSKQGVQRKTQALMCLILNFRIIHIKLI